MIPKIFIDGEAGTTGLRIASRLYERKDIELLRIREEDRKDPETRAALMNAADLVFLCLPDEAAIEAVGLADNPETKIIDTSTAHRTAEGWTYGFPELSAEAYDAITNAKRVANPGCHATGFIAIVAPLVAAGLLPKDSLLSCFSLTGYSGGGKKMIAAYEDEKRDDTLSSPGIYAVSQKHKHLPEMCKMTGLRSAPVFSPVVADYLEGMAVTVPFHASAFQGVDEIRDLANVYRLHYADAVLVNVVSDDKGTIYGNALAGKDTMTIVVAGNGERMSVTALFDNLGKGASGAAIQNMNLMLGFPETEGLVLS